jgi:hypothetical protein
MHPANRKESCELDPDINIFNADIDCPSLGVMLKLINSLPNHIAELLSEHRGKLELVITENEAKLSQHTASILHARQLNSGVIGEINESPEVKYLKNRISNMLSRKKEIENAISVTTDRIGKYKVRYEDRQARTRELEAGIQLMRNQIRRKSAVECNGFFESKHSRERGVEAKLESEGMIQIHLLQAEIRKTEVQLKETLRLLAAPLLLD